MFTQRIVVLGLSTGVVIFGADVTPGQSYPSRPVRIVTAETGGSGDLNARLIAQALPAGLGQPVIVENRAGAYIPIETVARAIPDGYTLLTYSSGMWTTPLIQRVSYDPVRDFSPITLTGNSPNVLVVHPSVPVKSVGDLINLAKAKPGAFNYSSSETGASSHLAAELFKSMSGVDIVRITYKGNGPALNAVVGGEVQMTFASAAAVAPQLKSGRVIALAVSSAKPAFLFPGLPTVAASLPGFEIVTSFGLFAPAKTPSMIIKRLNEEVVRVLNRVEVKERFAGAGIEIVGSSSEEFAAAIKGEVGKLERLIKDAGIKPD